MYHETGAMLAIFQVAPWSHSANSSAEYLSRGLSPQSSPQCLNKYNITIKESTRKREIEKKAQSKKKAQRKIYTSHDLACQNSQSYQLIFLFTFQIIIKKN